MDTPFEDLSEADKHLIFYGSDGKEFHFHYENEFGGVRDVEIPFEGVAVNVERRYRETNSDFTRNQMRSYMNELTCATCHATVSMTRLSLFVSEEKRGCISGKCQIYRLRTT